MKKLFSKKTMMKVCSACLFVSHVLFFDEISVLLFGEPEYPAIPEEQ